MKKAVVLVSGGADSATILAIAKTDGFSIHAISFDYGQRHLIELEMAKNLTRNHADSYRIIKLDQAVFLSSALANNKIMVEKFASTDTIPDSIPNTYVPARNTLFLSYALSYAESISATHIFIGVHGSDVAQYPDCRPEFIAQFQELANIATATQFKIQIMAPLLTLSKAQVIERGLKLAVDYSSTISCYDPDQSGISCGSCLACRVRIDAFAQNGAIDPIKYQS